MNKYIDINKNEGKIDKDYGAILDCVNNILGTQKGSLAFKRKFGINIEKYLFEPFSPHIIPLIKAEVIRSLRTNCPFLDIIKVFVEPDPYTESYNVEVQINAKGLPELVSTFIKYNKLKAK